MHRLLLLLLDHLSLVRHHLLNLGLHWDLWLLLDLLYLLHHLLLHVGLLLPLCGHLVGIGTSLHQLRVMEATWLIIAAVVRATSEILTFQNEANCWCRKSLSWWLLSHLLWWLLLLLLLWLWFIDQHPRIVFEIALHYNLVL